MNITKNAMVSIHYTVKDQDGNQVDSSIGGEPLEYLHGNGYLIIGLEKQLEGKAPGDKLTCTVEPKEAYGEYDESMVIEVNKSQFDAGVDIEVGMQFQAGGGQIVTVKKVDGDTVTIDANHELAGKTLTFDVEIVDVREATEEELNPQGCGCGGSCGGGCGGSCGDGGCGDGGCGGGCGCGN